MSCASGFMRRLGFAGYSLGSSAARANRRRHRMTVGAWKGLGPVQPVPDSIAALQHIACTIRSKWA